MIRVTSLYGKITIAFGNQWKNGSYNGVIWPFITGLGVLLALLLGTVPEGGLAASWPWLLAAAAAALLVAYLWRRHKRKTADMISEIMDACEKTAQEG